MSLNRTWPFLAAAILMLTLASFLYFPRSIGKGANEVLKLAARAGSTEEKITLYEKAATFPKATQKERFGASSALASLLMEQGRTEEALEWFEMALQNGSPGETTYQSTVVQYANALLQADQPARAASLLKNTIESIKDPGLKRVARDRYAVALVRTENFEEAVRQYEFLIASTPEAESFMLTINYADAVSRCGDHAKALNLLEHLMTSQKGQRSTVAWTRAEIRVRMKRYPEAIADYFLVARDPDAPPNQQADALLKIASLFILQKDRQKADRILTQALEEKADANQIALRVIELARIASMNDRDTTLGAWIDRLEGHPKAQVLLLTRRGNLALEQGRKEDALSWFQQALAMAEGEVERQWLQQIIQDIESEKG